MVLPEIKNGSPERTTSTVSPRTVARRAGAARATVCEGRSLKVDPAVTSVLLHRLGQAAAHHDAYASVE